MVVSALGRHDTRAQHTLREMTTYHMLDRLQHFRGFQGFSRAELELLRRELQQLVVVLDDVLDEER